MILNFLDNRPHAATALCSPGRFLVFISLRGRVIPRAKSWLVGLRKLQKSYDIGNRNPPPSRFCFQHSVSTNHATACPIISNFSPKFCIRKYKSYDRVLTGLQLLNNYWRRKWLVLVYKGKKHYVQDSCSSWTMSSVNPETFMRNIIFDMQ
jgi:hypothetical protein